MRMHMRTGDFVDVIRDIVGYKSGLNIDEQKLIDYMLEVDDDYSFDNPDSGISIRAEEVQAFVDHVLLRIGNIKEIGSGLIIYEIYKKYKTKDNIELMLTNLLEFLEKTSQKAITQRKPLDIMEFIQQGTVELGEDYKSLLIDISDLLIKELHKSVMSKFRVFEWKNEIELKELFYKENMNAFYGKFFDQRYIDFLFANFEDIGKINWRKFEQLTGEFFAKLGFHVEVGPGRNDGGIDVRVWPKEKDKENPPLILIQCKRQKTKIEKVVIKALYADILDEDATSGLIVTTSTLAPGTEEVRIARNYPINYIDRDNLKNWIEAFRS